MTKDYSDSEGDSTNFPNSSKAKSRRKRAVSWLTVSAFVIACGWLLFRSTLPFVEFQSAPLGVSRHTVSMLIPSGWRVDPPRQTAAGTHSIVIEQPRRGGWLPAALRRWLRFDDDVGALVIEFDDHEVVGGTRAFEKNRVAHNLPIYAFGARAFVPGPNWRSLVTVYYMRNNPTAFDESRRVIMDSISIR